MINSKFEIVAQITENQQFAFLLKTDYFMPYFEDFLKSIPYFKLSTIQIRENLRNKREMFKGIW